MRARYCTIVLLIVVGHLFAEMHSVLYWVNPDTAYYYVDDWFLKSGFKVDKLSILWFFKMLEDTLSLAVLLFAGAIQAYSRNYKNYLEWQRYSVRLYFVWCLYFAYHVFDFWMLFYNYKSSYLLYAIVLCIVSLLALFIGFYRIKQKE